MEQSKPPLAAGVRAGQTRRPFSIPRTPTLLASPRTSNAPSPSRSTRSPAESASRPPCPPLLPRQSSALSSTTLLHPSAVRLKVTVSFPEAPLSSLDPFPTLSSAAAGGTPPRAPWPPLRPPRAASARSRATPPRFRGSPGPLAARAPHLRRRLATARPDCRAAARAPAQPPPSPCLAVAARVRPGPPPRVPLLGRARAVPWAWARPRCPAGRAGPHPPRALPLSLYSLTGGARCQGEGEGDG